MSEEPLSFSYDAFTDIMTIDGAEYSGEFFRTLGEKGLAIGDFFRVENRRDGVITIRRFTDKAEYRFNRVLRRLRE